MISIIVISIIFDNNTTFFLNVIIRYDKCHLSPGSQNVQWSSQGVLRKPYVILRTLLDPRPVARKHGTNGVTTRTCFWYFYILYIVYHWIGLGEHLQETSIFNGKNHGFLSIFPTKPIQWVYQSQNPHLNWCAACVCNGRCSQLHPSAILVGKKYVWLMIILLVNTC